VRFLVCQEVADERAEGRRLLAELDAQARTCARQTLPAAKLLLGLKCGGSDGFSGITANPCVGALSDRLIAQGGAALLTEVPEMFGAEQVLLDRCVDRAVFDQAAALMEGFKAYFTAHGQTVYENPSPGNKAGGITTLEDKSLGCVQKGGTAPVMGVVPYGGQSEGPGLRLLWGPGNDLVSTTALAAAGAQMVLFTTGRGTPFAGPVPTLKIASNTALYEAKPHWMDFDAGPIARGEPIQAAAERLWRLVLKAASGEIPTQAERNGCRGIAIFKDGVTL
jgi:altronate hydrolase